MMTGHTIRQDDPNNKAEIIKIEEVPLLPKTSKIITNEEYIKKNYPS